MALIIFLLIIGMPILELTVLIDVGDEIGAFNTVLLCLLTAGVGLSIVRMQGIKVFQDMQQQAQTGETIGNNLIHGFFLLLAGVFLFIPGFVTDAFGAVLLIPFVRLALGRAGMAHMVVKTYRGQHRGGREDIREDIIVEGEYKRYDAQKNTWTNTRPNTQQKPQIEVIPPQKPEEDR